MSVAVIIPARYASTRLPGKPLLRETGKYLIQHVCELAARSRWGENAVVAVDDEGVRAAVESFGGRAVMTRIDHISGTDRIAEVAANLDVDIIVNLQGDEPQFEPSALDLLVQLLLDDPTAGMATLMTPIRDAELYRNPNAVKVIADDSGRALCFSRAPIPFGRDGEPDLNAEPPPVHLHLGVYAYRRKVLLELASAPPHPWEQLEKLEQLRFLARGGILRIASIPKAHRGIDTPADYAAFVAAHHAGM